MPTTVSKATMRTMLWAALAVVGAASEAATADVCRAETGATCNGAGDHVLIQVKHAKVKQHKTHQLDWPGTGEFVSGGEWCKGEIPATTFSLKHCGSAEADHPLSVKVMSYNLFWWNLYGIRNGDGNSAGRLIADHQEERYYDFMAFQECDDVNRILLDARNAGLSGAYDAVPAAHALGIVYRTSRWSLLDSGVDDVAEDHASQWYGNRGAQWARLEHKDTHKTVILVNHHGPLPVNTGGKCGGRATAFNILHTVATRAEEGDEVILTGDFNAGNVSETIPELDTRLNRVFTGESFGGVDHIFSSSCSGHGRRLGLGGSDHEAIDATIRI